MDHGIAVSRPGTWGGWMALLGHGRGGTTSGTAAHGAGCMASSLKRVFWPNVSGTQSWLISQRGTVKRQKQSSDREREGGIS